MTTHEVRFRGELVGHMGEGEAHKYLAPRESGEGWTVAPRRPVELYESGTLVDTFDEVASADAERARRAERATAPRGHPAPVLEVVDTRAAETYEKAPVETLEGEADTLPSGSQDT